MSKINERLTLVANLSVVVSIVFLAVQMRENTRAIRSQTRDSITEKQMEYLGWRSTSPELAAAIIKSGDGPQALTQTEVVLYSGYVAAQMREWENSYYQYTQGLFSLDEYEARSAHWEMELRNASMRALWSMPGGFRLRYAADFRAEIDSMVARIEARDP